MPNMLRKLLIIREIFKGDHNAVVPVAMVVAARKLRRKQISSLSGPVCYSTKRYCRYLTL